jgi:hypothetical protein
MKLILSFLGKITANVPAAWRSGGFSVPKLLKIPEFRLSTFASKKALNPPFRQTACYLLFLLAVFHFSFY